MAALMICTATQKRIRRSCKEMLRQQHLHKPAPSRVAVICLI